MNTLTFTVDSQLLRELGERLVGKSEIALGELIKNSYDADATSVEIEFSDENGGTIIITDNGHGMSFKEFKNYWMRIGSTHKKDWHTSPGLKRPLTGQKGVGRLAVQMLAKEMRLFSISKGDLKTKLEVYVCWEKAIEKGDLVKADVEYQLIKGKYKQGTTIVLSGLIDHWHANQMNQLAKELWRLVPPIRGKGSKYGEFTIDLKSADKEFEKNFKTQITAVLNAYEAKIYGKNDNGNVKVSITNRDWGSQVDHEYNINDITDVTLDYSKGSRKKLVNGEFEIRIYRLERRQPFGIKIDDLRNYMKEFAGIHIYDSGFHLPYYGSKESDWLGILDEQARRLTLSEYLPDELQISEGLSRLPTLKRMLGVVNINTANEDGLEIAITRDRLVETDAYLALRGMIRYALHLYATEDKRQRDSARPKKKYSEIVPIEKAERVEEVLEKYRVDIPNKVFTELKSEVDMVISTIDDFEEKTREQVSLMGALATAGISTLSYHHEIKRQVREIDGITKDLDTIAKKNPDVSKELLEIKKELISWVGRSKSIESLFSYYSDADNISQRVAIPARKVIDDVDKQLERLKGEIKIKNNVSKDIILPEASLIEWGSIFQNVLLNAFNAMEKSENKEIEITDFSSETHLGITVEDKGCGINLKDADELFLPFVRRLEIPDEKKRLGYGGTGLGLTIVRAIAERIGCRVAFVEPKKGFKTAFRITWRKKND